MAAGLSRSRIVQAALQVVQTEGLDALSMRKVARRLDVEAMSLYRHVTHKADLLDGLHEYLLSQVPLAGEGAWRHEVQLLAQRFRAVLFAHPRCVPLLATRPAGTPHALAVVESGVTLLERQGLAPERAVAAFQAVFSFVVGHAMFHLAGGALHSDDAWARTEFDEGLQLLIEGIEHALRPTDPQ